MTQRRLLLALALLAAAAWSGTANATFSSDTWGVTADGSMDQHPEEGYAISGGSNYRFTKSYHHMTYLVVDPSALSDGPDKIAPGKIKGGVNDSNDGVGFATWMIGKKAFAASVYLRNASAQTCDPTAAAGTYLNDPVVVLGFRVANLGVMNDKGVNLDGTLPAEGLGGCCAGYSNALILGGENAPPAWRMGRPAVTGDKYSAIGAIGLGDAYVTPEYYKVSAKDSLYAGRVVKVDPSWAGVTNMFGTAGLGGFSTNSPGLSGAGRFAFDWLVQRSDAMVVNSGTINETDCTSLAGEMEPRDTNNDGNIAEGWFAKHIDRCIIQGMAGDPEMKALVFNSTASAFVLNTSMFAKEQGGGIYAPYITINATYLGDVNNNGAVDSNDLLLLAPAWGLKTGVLGFNGEADIDCNGTINVVDLLYIADQFGQS